MSNKRKKKGHIGRKILFGFEILVLAALVGVLFLYTQINKKMDKLEFDNTNIKGESIDVQINRDVVGSEVLSGYTNIALFGLDKRDEKTDGIYGNSDTAMVASINNDTKEIRLVSLYRDTYLRVNPDKNEDGVYNKCNSAYLQGGPSQAITMINTNMDLDIEKYVAVDFNAMVAVIDCLGGLDIPLSFEELRHMNNYCKETSKVTGKDYTPLEEPAVPADQTKVIGTYHLNGVQALSYCRIRQTLSADMGRTERQRRVLGLMAEKAKKSSLTTLTDILDQVFPMVQTNFSKAELFKLGASILSYNITETSGFPVDFVMGKELTEPVTGLDCVIPTTLETNVRYLHEFLFDEKDYQPSEDVIKRSDFILNRTGFGEGYIAEERKYLIQERKSSGTEETSSDYEEDSGYGEDSYGYDDYEESSYGYGGYEESSYDDDSYDVDETYDYSEYDY